MIFRCKACGKTYDEQDLPWRCECGESLYLSREVNFHKENIRAGRFDMWRYEEALPISAEECKITFGEGLTPLVPIRWDDADFLLKNESMEPTGSFKDRGVSLIINYLARHGVKDICEDSSGNAGAAAAAYCAGAGIGCHIFTPDYTSRGKLSQVEAFGAALHLVPGTRSDAAHAAQNAECGAYCGHNWHPMFIEGVKTMAYELWEQCGFQAPDSVICPVGNGGIAEGLYLGFSELKSSGEIDRIPSIYGIQPQNCDPIVRTYQGDHTVVQPQQTVAEGISVAEPTRAGDVAELVRESGGIMLSVTETQIKTALKKAVKMGLYMEPTSAAAFAGASVLKESGVLPEGGRNIIVLSGNGLKATEKIKKIMEEK